MARNGVPGVVDSLGALIDNLTLNSVSATPLPGALPLFGSVLSLFPFVGWWRKRRRHAAMAMA